MDINILQYIENPMGPGSAALPSRQLLIQDYTNRMMKLEADNDLTPLIFYDKYPDVYYLFFQIPSEGKGHKNSYDVVLKFSPANRDQRKNARTIGEYNMQMFSNSPSFVYTFGYTYYKQKILIDFLAKEKYDKEILKTPPKLRNPQQAMTYEKSTVFAMLYLLKDRKFLNKLIIDPIAKPFSEKKLLDLVRNDEKAKVDAQREAHRVRDAAKALEAKQKKEAFKTEKNNLSQNTKQRSKTSGSKKGATKSSTGMRNASNGTVRKPRKAIRSNVRRK